MSHHKHDAEGNHVVVEGKGVLPPWNGEDTRELERELARSLPLPESE